MMYSEIGILRKMKNNLTDIVDKYDYAKMTESEFISSIRDIAAEMMKFDREQEKYISEHFKNLKEGQR